MIDAAFIIDGFIGQHEGGLSLQPADNGNWYDPARYAARPKQLPQRRGMGQLVGSKYGVTAYPLVRYRVRKGREAAAALHVLRGDIDAIDRPTAVQIGVDLYLIEPALDRLVWNRVTASVLDKGWGSGPDTAILLLQRLIGVEADGGIGPATIAAYAAWIGREGEETAAHLWCGARIAFDEGLVSGPSDPDRAFIGGWNNRSRSFLPGTPWWRAAA